MPEAQPTSRGIVGDPVPAEVAAEARRIAATVRGRQRTVLGALQRALVSRATVYRALDPAHRAGDLLGRDTSATVGGVVGR